MPGKVRRRVASVALDAAIGKRAAELMGWRGARLAQDDVLWKPPGAQGVSYHTDGNTSPTTSCPETTIV